MKNLIILSLLLVGSLSLFSQTEISNTEPVSDETNDPKIMHLVFEDLNDEYLLAKIFFNSEQKRHYKKLDDPGKRLFLNAFWAANDPNPNTEVNELIEILKDRIKFSNEKYGHFKKGWKSDRGRILIRHGIPYEIITGRSDILAKSSDKEYEIWKYRISKDLTYIFLVIFSFRIKAARLTAKIGCNF